MPGLCLKGIYCSICSCSFKSRIPRANFNPYVKQSKWCWRDGVEYRVCRYHNGGEAACSQAVLHGFFQMHPEAGNFGLLDALQVVSAFCSLQSS